MKKLITAAMMVASSAAMANPFSVGTTLYGDPRDTNPNQIQLTVSGDVDGSTGSLMVDLGPSAPFHADSKLLSFYMNLDGVSADYDFYNFNPDWSVTGTEVTNPQGGGGAANSTQFLFSYGANAPAGQNTVTPLQPLTFDFARVDGTDFVTTDFGDAPTWESNNLILGGGQLGAHVGGLTVDALTCPAGGCSESGFATGDWTAQVTPVSVASPGTMALLGLGLIGLGLARKRQIK